jgi:tetratricopeptide (TPR) repeat protein
MLLLGMLLHPSNVAAETPIRTLMDHGAWKEARVRVDALTRTAPDSASTFYLRSRVLAAFGDLPGALENAEQAVKRSPRDADAHYQLAVASGMLARHSGPLRQLSLGRRFKSEAEAALRLDPRQMDARDALIEFHLVAPGVIGGSRATAARLADELVALDAARGRLAQAKIALRDGDSTRAQSSYQAAVAADPHRYEAHLLYSQFLAAGTAERWEAAEAQAREAIASDPTRAGGYAVLAAQLAHHGRWSDLDALLEQSAQEVPGNLTPFYQTARVLLTDGHEFPRAENALRRYLSQAPEGNTPDAAAAHWRLGLVLEKEGRTPETIRELETAVRLRPNFDEAKKDLKRLRKN